MTTIKAYPLQSEIMAKWRKKVAQHHPDKGGDAETFQQMNEAKDLGLSTIRRR